VVHKLENRFVNSRVQNGNHNIFLVHFFYLLVTLPIDHFYAVGVALA
jgi:hypothetical protein